MRLWHEDLLFTTFPVNPYFYEYKSAPDLCYRPPWQNSNNFGLTPTRSRAAGELLHITHLKSRRPPASSFDRPDSRRRTKG
jgi:hypothetical protein